MKNIIKSQFTETDRTSIEETVSDLEAKIEGKTGILSAEERKRYGSINEQNKLIVNKARDNRQNKPQLSAPDVDWTEFESDYGSRGFLDSVIDRLEAITQKLKNTKIMHDYDNLQDALKDYGYSQYRYGAGDEEYGPKVNDYKQFFARSKSAETEDGGDDEDGETDNQ